MADIHFIHLCTSYVEGHFHNHDQDSDRNEKG